MLGLPLVILSVYIYMYILFCQHYRVYGLLFNSSPALPVLKCGLPVFVASSGKLVTLYASFLLSDPFYLLLIYV